MTALVPITVVGFFVLAFALIGGVGAPDPRFTPCIQCKHLRIEHRRDGRSCDVRTPEDDHANADRCECPGFRAKAGHL